MKAIKLSKRIQLVNLSSDEFYSELAKCPKPAKQEFTRQQLAKSKNTRLVIESVFASLTD